MLEIYRLGEDVLREKTKDVKVFDSAFSLLIDAMFETLDDADGVGLAAPQIGVSERFFIVDLHRGSGSRYVFVNPEIIETSLEEVPYEEGCLSVPGVYRNIMRPEKIKVQAQNVEGKRFTIEAEGLLARVIQHENDHLNGKLFIDYLPPEDQEKIEKRMRKMEKKEKRRRK